MEIVVECVELEEGRSRPNGTRVLGIGNFQLGLMILGKSVFGCD